ncbi:hypothetical protein CCP3SC1AL1_350001 [Gammaproteobacteria bacterium]
MASNPSKKSVLLLTSAATDVQYSGGDIFIAGLNTVSRKDITSIKQVKSRAEVAQVTTVGAVTLYTPTSNTAYKVAVWDVLRKESGYEETPKIYTYITGTVTGVAATDREVISVALCALINADASNHAVAATLTGGAGFTVTDDGGYWPVFAQNMTNVKGVNNVYTITNNDGTGFTGTTLLGNASVTTVGVYSKGLGANLLAQRPIVDFVYGNLISGVLGDAPMTNTNPQLPAVSGQNYDTFIIESLKAVDAIQATGQYAYIESIQRVFVDNGTGSATTNATGFAAFQREFYKLLFAQFENDPATIYDFFEVGLTASATYPTDGTAISTTDNKVMAANSRGNTWYINPIGAHTLLTPLVTTAGLTPYLDVTTQEGIELSPSNLTQSSKQFVVGKGEASFYARITFGGIAATDWKTLSVGFRKKAAYAVDQTAYEAASVATACLGVPLDTGAAPVVNMITGPGSAGALTNTSCVVSPTAGSSVDLLVTVDINGLTKFYVNGVDKTPLRASNYTFTAGLNLMPFISFRHGAGAAAAPAVVQTAFVPSIQWFG